MICKYKGEVKKCPAVRGSIIGDQRLADIPVRIGYKKMNKQRLARHDLYKFDIKPYIEPEAACEVGTESVAESSR